MAASSTMLVAVPLLLAIVTAAVVADGMVLPTLSNVFSGKATISNAPEGVTTLLETYMDGPRGRLLQNWSSPFGFSAHLVLGDLQEFYLLFMVNDTLQCVGGPTTLPRTFPPPNYAGLGQPNAVMVGPLGRPAYRIEGIAGKYIGSYLLDQMSGLPVGNMNAEVDFTSTAVFDYVNGTVTDPAALELPSACTAPTAAPHGSHVVRAGDSLHRLTLSKEYTEALADPVGILQFHFGVAAAQAVGNPLVPNVHPALAAAESVAAETPRSVKGVQVDLPAAVDNSEFATPIRNQGVACGACWAFASVAASEVVSRKAQRLNRTYDVTQWLSVQTLIDCAHDGPNSTALVPSKGCQGGWPSTALNFIVQHGVPMERGYVFQGVTGLRCHLPDVVKSGQPIIRPISRWYQTSYLNTTEMMEAVHVHGAVVSIILFFLTPPAGNALYSGGVYSNAACTPGLSHAVTIVGYGTTSDGLDYWLVKNSLGPGWGEGGYFKMARGINMCGIEDFGFVPVF